MIELLIFVFSSTTEKLPTQTGPLTKTPALSLHSLPMYAGPLIRTS